MAPDPAELSASIYNACWFVRQCRGRNSLRRQQAILALGLACRAAFNSTDNFEPVLTALLDGLSPKDDSRF